MIGDWISYIPEIAEGEDSYLGEPHNIQVDLSCLQKIDELIFAPIPLTAEILEKDGWERDIDKEWKYNNSHILPHYCYQWEKRNVKIEMYSGLEGFTISLIIGRRFYAVHELQHVLRLYGLDELADNFKI